MKDTNLTIAESAVRQAYPRPDDIGGMLDQMWWEHFFAIEAEWLAGKNANVKVNTHPHGRWLHQQRQICKRGELHPERKKALEYLGVWWDYSVGKTLPHFEIPLIAIDARQPFRRPQMSSDASVIRWWATFAILEAMWLQGGDVNALPEGSLYNWASVQRKCSHKGELSTQRTRALNHLGFWWGRAGNNPCKS